MTAAWSYLPPERVLVVGAGIVGMSCAWSLQDHGVEVRVVDRLQPGAGASWQNAGLRVAGALRSVAGAGHTSLRRAGRLEPEITRPGLVAERPPAHFLHGPAWRVHCTAAQWRRGMAAYRPLNEQVAQSYERQCAGGVETELVSGDVLACFDDKAGSKAFVARGPGDNP